MVLNQVTVNSISTVLSHRKTEIFYSSFCGGGPHGCNIRFTLTVSILKSRPYGPNNVGAHLAHLKLDPPNRLSIRNCEVRIQSRVTDDRCERVPVLVRQPLTESGGSASRSDSRSAALTYYFVISAWPIGHHQNFFSTKKVWVHTCSCITGMDCTNGRIDHAEVC